MSPPLQHKPLYVVYSLIIASLQQGKTVVCKLWEEATGLHAVLAFSSWYHCTYWETIIANDREILFWSKPRKEIGSTRHTFRRRSSPKFESFYVLWLQNDINRHPFSFMSRSMPTSSLSFWAAQISLRKNFDRGSQFWLLIPLKSRRQRQRSSHLHPIAGHFYPLYPTYLPGYNLSSSLISCFW